WAASYDDHDPTTWLDEPFLLEHLQPFPGCRILDIGSGTGRYLRRLTPFQYRVVAIDFSKNMLSRADGHLGQRPDVSLVQASAATLPFLPCTFDRIMSGLVLDHLRSPEQFFKEMSAVLTPVGRGVVAAVHPEMQRVTGSDIQIQGCGDDIIHIPGHVHEIEHLVAAAREAGMSVVAMEEPRVTADMLTHRPAWRRKIGRSALLLLALTKTTSA
ncbi:MAG TPA: class I SAM-dependent methyltransferase, partial [Nitrospira sp.]|nr:class I SAM-dependent methyltransferase [Nitrospira sp.]